MNASPSINLSGPSNTISSSFPIPSSSSSLSTMNNTPTQLHRQDQDSTDLTEEERPIPYTASKKINHSTSSADQLTSTAPLATTTSNSSLMVKMNNQVSATQCSNCGTTTTPLWRRAPNGDTICNACGLYLKARHTYRPTTMKRNNQAKKAQQQQQQQQQLGDDNSNDSEGGGLVSGTCPGGGKCNGTGGSSSCAGCPAFNQHQVHRHTTLMCANCRTTTTPLWRRDGDGNTICNACGLYYKLHHVHRPVSMKRSVIKRRKRLIVVAADGSTTGSVDGTASDDEDGEEFDQLAHEDDEEYKLQLHQQQQPPQQQPDGAKKPRKPYRKRVKPQEVDALGKSKRNRTTTAATATQQSQMSASSVSSVPAIEDYIVPKRTAFPNGSTTTTPLSAPVSPSSLASPSISSSSSLPSPSSASSTPSLSTMAQMDHRQHHRQHQHSSTMNRLTPSIRTEDNSPSSLSLPPISSERRSAHLNSFYSDNRPANTSTVSPSPVAHSSLPPISLPPLRPTATTPVTTASVLNNGTSSSSSPPMHHPSPVHPNMTDRSTTDTSTSSAFMSALPANHTSTNNSDYLTDFYRRQQQQQQVPEFMELEDWDEALKSLKSLRRKVQPEHVRALAQLSKPLWDMVSKAQSIVHGTGALSQQ